jgi:glutamate/tyrosine decarboxylase-like PLP-dependent enzyme
MEKKPWFLGPKGENSDVMERFILESIRDYISWRRNFHPEDERIIFKKERRSLEFQESLDIIEDHFSRLLDRMKDSFPFFSSRYIAHMASETLIPANIGYFLGMLYNQNNVTSEASPVTTQLEQETILDLIEMIGYDKNAWGHITADGSIANFEALWVGRNQTYFPLAARRIAEKYDLSVNIKIITNEKEVDIRNMDDDISFLNLFDPRNSPRLREELYAAAEKKNLDMAIFDEDLFNAGLSGTGLNSDEIKYPIASIFVPQTAHYSIRKMVEALGLGRKNIIKIEVDDQFSIDISDLEAKIEKYIDKTVIMMVIPIIGTTEAGAVDPLHKIIELRDKKIRERKCSFLIHADAAYGGYAKTVSKDILPSHVVEAFNSMKHADFITIDPHKMGYIPYPAGTILLRDKRVRNFVVCNAPYVFKGGKEEDEEGYLKFIGQFILEGSKPGSAATACWLAHKCVPLNQEGYGKIIGDTINAIVALKSRLSNNKKIGKYIQFLTEPDLNILCFRINFPERIALDDMNKINRKIYLSFQEGKPFSEAFEKQVEVRRFILSETSFKIRDFPFLKEKFRLSNFGDEESVTFLRISLMNPYSKFLFEKFEKNLEEKVIVAKKEYNVD